MYRLGLCIKKFAKKKKSRDADLTEISLGVILSLSHTHIGLP